jgi:hypothetical protein
MKSSADSLLAGLCLVLVLLACDASERRPVVAEAPPQKQAYGASDDDPNDKPHDLDFHQFDENENENAESADESSTRAFANSNEEEGDSSPPSDTPTSWSSPPRSDSPYEVEPSRESVAPTTIEIRFLGIETLQDGSFGKTSWRFTGYVAGQEHFALQAQSFSDSRSDNLTRIGSSRRYTMSADVSGVPIRVDGSDTGSGVLASGSVVVDAGELRELAYGMGRTYQIFVTVPGNGKDGSFVVTVSVTRQ